MSTSTYNSGLKKQMLTNLSNSMCFQILLQPSYFHLPPRIFQACPICLYCIVSHKTIWPFPFTLIYMQSGFGLTVSKYVYKILSILSEVWPLKYGFDVSPLQSIWLFGSLFRGWAYHNVGKAIHKVSGMPSLETEPWTTMYAGIQMRDWTHNIVKPEFSRLRFTSGLMFMVRKRMSC
jgi:hypothetical protein